MRFLRGESLPEVVRRFYRDAPGQKPGERNLAFRRLLSRFVAVCNAVAYAHSRGVVHCNLRPEKVLLGSFGEVLVVDWGEAKVLYHSEVPPAGAEQTLLLTPAAGSDDVGPTGDVHSLGAMLGFLLTGEEVPAEGEAPPRFPSRVPQPLAAICRQAMAPRPAERYPSAHALADDVERWLAGEPVSTYREPWTRRLARWVRFG